MSKVIAGVTTSVDGYVAGPDDGPGRGLGTGGERLHHWVFGGPWTYDEGPRGEATGEDRAWLESAMSHVGAVVAGRGTYEASERWGDRNPWSVPLLVVTHRRTSSLTQSGGSPSSATSRARSARRRTWLATRTSTSWAGPTSSARPSRRAWSTS